MWHGQFMLLPLIRMSDVPVDVMLARHGDAEALGQTLKHFDMQLIRGAGAGSRAKDRGGTHAFRAAVQSLRDGRTVAMTADVPGAEARRAGLGIVMVARQSGRPILPVAIATSRYISFNAGERSTVNLPYSGIGFAVGPLVTVPREAPPEQLETYRQAVEDGLNIATEFAYQRASADPTRATPLAARNGRTGSACASRPTASSPAWPGPSPASSARAARQGRPRTSAGAARSRQRCAAGRQAGLVPCRQRRRDQCHPAADGGAGRGRRSATTTSLQPRRSRAQGASQESGKSLSIDCGDARRPGAGAPAARRRRHPRS